MYIENHLGRQLLIDANGITDKEIYKIDESEFITAQMFIIFCCQEQKTKNKEYSSYYLKHQAENFGYYANKTFGLNTKSYISNGTFILCAYSLGYKIYDLAPNCFFNIKVLKKFSR